MNNFFTNKNVLITGGCGFIGSRIAHMLVKLGANVTILDNLSTGTLHNIATIQENVHFIQGSIEDLNTCYQATHNQEIVFHLAAFISVPLSFTNPDQCHATNVTGTFNILHAATVNNVATLVFSSSAAVYGPSNRVCHEDDLCAPQSPYGYSKLIGELYCQQYARLFATKTIIARYFNVYGLGQNGQGSYAAAVAKFTHCMHNNVPITIFGDGLQTRDFIHVDQVAQANLKLATAAPENSGQVFNIGSGTSITLLELIERLKKDFPHYNQPIQFEPARSGDIKLSAADCSRFEKIKDGKSPDFSGLL